MTTTTRRATALARAASLVLALCGAAALLAIAAFVYRYGLHERALGLPGALAAVAFVCLASLRLRPAFRVAAAVVLLSASTLVYGVETILTLVQWRQTFVEPLWSIDGASPSTMAEIRALGKEFGVEIDTRHRDAVLASLRRTREDVVPAVLLGSVLEGVSADATARSDALVPLGGISDALTVLCNQSGQFITYESDEYGFRNPRGVWSLPRVDLAVVGQSFAQGYCVRDGKGFVDLLRHQYPATLNLGMSGGTPLLQLAAIREYLPRYEPDAVLWIFCEYIDLHDYDGEAGHPLLMKYLEPGFTQNLMARQNEVDAMLKLHLANTATSRRAESAWTARDTALSILKLWRLRGWLTPEIALKDRGEIQGRLALLRESLAEADALVESWGGRLYVVTLPSWIRYQNGPGALDAERQQILEMLGSLGITVIDAQAAFDAHPDPLALFPFRRFGHYNEAGHRLVAQSILAALPPRAEAPLTASRRAHAAPLAPATPRPTSGSTGSGRD